MNKLYVIGIDMGGTNTTFGIVDSRGIIHHKSAMLTGQYNSGEAYVEALVATLDQLIESSGLRGQIKAIGMGAPNGNYRTGTLENAANIPWANNKVVHLAQMISDKTGLDCKLTNDANAAALGEMAYGAARGMKDFLVITLGTGVGSGIVCNGQLVVGHDGFAGELGHVTMVRNNGRPCGCGRLGCLEAYTSANGVARTAREFLELSEEPSVLRAIVDREISSKDVFLAAEQGDPLAISVFDYTGKMLGQAFCDFIATFSPEAIILFGGLAHAGDHLMKPLQEEIDRHILGVFKEKTAIILSQLNDSEAAILGASALAWE